MAIKATSQMTIVDLADGKSLSVYVTSNHPKTQGFDPNTSAYSPSWASTVLTLTPVIFADQTSLALNATGLTITWKRKEGSTTETAITTGESVASGVLTVNQNKLSSVASGLLTYLCYITYLDPDTGLTVNAVADVTFALVKSALNAKLAYATGEQAFKYDSLGAVSPAQITLTGTVSGVTISKWQYLNSSSVWTDYPTTADNATITGGTLTIKPTHAVFNNDRAVIRLLTSDAAIYDDMSIYRVRDGAAGGSGASASMVFLTNENITFAGNASGQVAAITVPCNVVAYTGATKVTPVLGTITGAPSGMTVTAGAAVSNEIPLSIAIAANSTLGGAGQLNGIVLIPITSPVNTTLQLTWAKVNTGATGSTGASAVVFSLYAPNGDVFKNQGGSLLLQTAAYEGSTAISSGATYAWSKYTGGSWVVISGQTGASLTVAGTDVVGVGSYRCQMTYKSAVYTDTYTLTDKTDSYQAEIMSTGGSVFKNTQGTSFLYCFVSQNGIEADPLKLAGSSVVMSATAPGSPTSGMFWYQLSGKTVTLMKHNGTAWAAATGADLHALTYTWYRRDKNGNTTTPNPFKTGKVIYVDGADVDVKTTFVCEVS